MPTPRKLYADLLGRPYIAGGGDPSEGLSCSGAVLEVLRRLGFELPAGALPLGHDGAPTHLAEQDAGPWARVGGTIDAARLPGDVVLLAVSGGLHHVAVSLGDRMLLSSDEKRGVHLMRAGALPGEVLGVYRLSRA